IFWRREVRDVQLGWSASVAVRGPHQPLAIRGEHWKDILTGREGDADWLRLRLWRVSGDGTEWEQIGPGKSRKCRKRRTARKRRQREIPVIAAVWGFRVVVNPHPVQVVVRADQFVRVIGGGIDDVLAVLVPERSPEHPLVVRGQRLLAGAVYVDDIQLEPVLLLAVGAEDDLRAIRAQERPAVVALGLAVSDLLRAGAVGVHDEQ